MDGTKFIPPDGGWGWIIMLAYALNNIIFIPIIQCFGLIFRKTFSELGLSATDGSIIITTNTAFGLLMGIINGPLLRRFTFRQVALFGTCLVTGGIITTAFGTKFEHIFIAYGLITSFGFAICMSSYSLALNTYFLKNRGKAVGMAFTISSIGAILAPQLISYLLSVYTVHGTVLIMGAIATHGLIAAMLLHPVKWHLKKESIEEKNESLLEKEETTEKRQSSLVKSYSSPSVNVGNNTHSKPNFDAESLEDKSLSPQDDEADNAPVVSNQWWSSLHSVNSTYLENSLKLIEETKYKPLEKKELNDVKSSSYISLVFQPEVEIKNEKKIKKWWQSVVEFFDLTLFKDVIYVNMIIGISISVFAELNFSLLTPFILTDIGLNTQEIATFMSVLSAADLSCRFITPFIGDRFNNSSRIMYMISLIILIIGRSLLMMASTYVQLLCVAALLGLTRGIRTVYVALVIPSYVPLKRLAAASGFQMVLNGVLLLSGGPFLGMLRDNTGSYHQSVIIMNIITGLTIIAWTIEIVYLKLNKSKKLENIDIS